MKKLFIMVALAATTLCVTAENYKNSIGINIGSFYGLTYKGFFTDNMAFQADLGVSLLPTVGNAVVSSSIGNVTTGININSYTFEFNPNLIYQNDIQSFSWGNLYWLAGLGVNVGFLDALQNAGNAIQFKWGINAIGGVELKLANSPFVVSLDFRPGYGMSIPAKNSVYNFFDWKAVAGIKYAF